MPSHITAYCYIMGMALVVFALLRKPMTASLMTPLDFERRRNVWFAVTTAAFLSHNYWVYCVVAAMILSYSLQRERNPMALYFMVLAAVPIFGVQVPGFGVVNFLIELTHPSLLALVILTPMAFRLLRTREPMPPIFTIVHGLLLVYIVISFIPAAIHDTVANAIRVVIDQLLKMWLPFYVAGRSLRNIRELREAMATWVMALSLMGPQALFETGRGWIMYEGLRASLGAPPAGLTLYLLRDNDGGGFLRAVVTGGHSIALGYMVGVGICIWVALRASLQPPKYGLFVLAMLFAAFAASFSRGPWVSVVAGLLFITLTGPGFFKRLIWVTVVCAVLMVGLLFTESGQKFYGYLPFVGSTASDSVDYRVRLFEVSMEVFMSNPVFGNYRFLIDPRMEQMRQGQGIIDMVNTYLSVAMSYGIIGLTVFVLPFLIVLVGATWMARRVEPMHASMGVTGRVLAGAILATLMTIATASSVEYVPIVYWPLLGMGAAYIVMALRWAKTQRAASARQHQEPGRASRMPANSVGVSVARRAG